MVGFCHLVEEWDGLGLVVISHHVAGVTNERRDPSSLYCPPISPRV